MRMLPRSVRGTWLLAAAAWTGGCALVWWLLPPQPRAELRLPGRVGLVGMTADGNGVVTVDRTDFGWCGPARIWDTASGRQQAKLDALPHDHYVTHFCLSPDARSLLMCAADGPFSEPPLRVLDLVDGSLTELPGPVDRDSFEGSVGKRPHFSSDGRLLAYLCSTGAFHYQAWVYDLRTRREILAVPTTQAYALAPDGKSLAVGADDWSENVVVYEVGSRRPIVCIPTSPDRVCQMAYSPDGAVLATVLQTGRAGGGFRFWRADGRGELPVPPGPADYRIDAAGRVIARFPGEGDCDAMTVVSAAGATVRTAVRFDDSRQGLSPDGGVALLPVESGPPAWVEHLAGLKLLPASWLDWWGGRGRLVDTLTGRELGRIAYGSAPAWWEGDGRRVAVVDRGETGITVWDVPPRKPLTWFALAAAVLALPLAGLAWRRSRGLRREAV